LAKEQNENAIAGWRPVVTCRDGKYRLSPNGAEERRCGAASAGKVLASAKTLYNAQLAELMAINPELPLGPLDVLKEYEHGMALIAQGMSADVVNIARAVEANQLTREQAEYLIGETYQIAMMQYQVLSALHDGLERDVAQEATPAKRAPEAAGLCQSIIE
jgi:hypothetical protein